MIVAVHQPHFLPWLGYLDRMMKADLFVILDHVQFERRNYQNRTQILLDGRAHWLTVPVRQRSQQERVIDKLIDNPPATDTRAWGADHVRTLRHAYRDAPCLEDYAPTLQQILTARWERLVDLNQALLDFLRDALRIRTPMVRSSELEVTGARSELILNLCRVAGADTYLAGMGGSRGYLDGEAFAAAGIKLAWQEFRHPVYAQCGGGAFMPGLSAVDLLFNHGDAARGLLDGEKAQDEAAQAALV